MTAPKFRNDFSWNAIPGLVAVIVTVGGLIYSYASNTATVGEINRNMTDRAASAAVTHEKFDARIGTLEGQVRQIDNLAYRVTVVEQNGVTMSRVMGELNKAMSEQSADIKVIREILSRQDKGPSVPR